jgi:hypothetical protein
VDVQCGPGGACGSPAATALRAVAATAGLPELASAPLPGVAREVRVWGSDARAGAGRLRRFVEDSAGETITEEVVWWSAANARLRSEQRAWNGHACQSLTSGREFAICVVEQVGPPFAANRLRALGERGVWTLPGSPAEPDTTRQCVDVCVGPGRIIVEARVGHRYRTYGYAVPGASPDSVRRLLHEF